MASKQLPKWATTVTPLSKTIALLMFILLPIFGFFYGRYYQQQIEQQQQQSPIIYKIVTPHTSPSITQQTNGAHTCNTNADCPADYICTQVGPIVYSQNAKPHRTCWKKGSMMPM